MTLIAQILRASGPAALVVAGPGEVVCHGDFGPWNIVWRGPTSSACSTSITLVRHRRLSTSPTPRSMPARFGDDEESIRWLGYTEPPNRRRLSEIFCDAYGVAVPDDAARIAGASRASLGSRRVRCPAEAADHGVQAPRPPSLVELSHGSPPERPCGRIGAA